MNAGIPCEQTDWPVPVSETQRAAEGSALLLSGRWAPVTDCVLFVRATPDRAIDGLLQSYFAKEVLARSGKPLARSSLSALTLEQVLNSLLPLEAPIERRRLFVPTRNPEWCAVFGSFLRGMDPNGLMWDLSRAGHSSVAIVEAVHAPNRKPHATYGVRQISMAEVVRPGESITHVLGVRAASSRRWEVDRGLTEFPGGDVWDPGAVRIQDRFTHDHLVQMALRLGLHPFDEDFYVPHRGALLMEDASLAPVRWVFATLAQARGEAPMPEPVDIR